jgi:hypothetical protein
MDRKSGKILAITAVFLGGVFILFASLAPERSNKVTSLDEAIVNRDRESISAVSTYTLDKKSEIAPLKESNHVTLKQHDKTEKINALKKELQIYTETEIINEISSIKSKLYELDLIDRLNRDVVTERERDDANDILVRLALLGLEKAQRDLDTMRPKLESALKKHKENIAEIKELLKDEE